MGTFQRTGSIQPTIGRRKSVRRHQSFEFFKLVLDEDQLCRGCIGSLHDSPGHEKTSIWRNVVETAVASRKQDLRAHTCVKAWYAFIADQHHCPAVEASIKELLLLPCPHGRPSPAN